MTHPEPSIEPADLFKQEELTAELRDLLGPHLATVLQAAVSGSRPKLHGAERAWAAAAVAALDIDISMVGLDRVDPGGQYVVASLHEGFPDVLALLQLPLDLNWVIRDELLELPYFGDYLRTAGHIAVDPESPRTALRTIFKKASATIAAGESLVVFPQGSLLGIDIAFRAGAFRLAERIGLPILPVVLAGSHRVWEYPFNRTLRCGQHIHMEILEPIEPGDALSEMRELERNMKRRALAASSAPARRYVPERDGTWDGYSFELDPDFARMAAI